MKNIFSPQISACKKVILQHILIWLIKQWREYLDKAPVIDAIFADLPKALDCISRNLIIAKLEAYGPGKKRYPTSIHASQTEINEFVEMIQKGIFKR